MTITDEAKLNASVSDPYVLNAQVVVAKADKIDAIKAAADLKNLKVAVENGFAGQDAAEAAEITNIIKVQDQAAALLEVKSGTSDACVIDITMAKAMTGEGTDYADLKAGISLTEEEYGVAFRKDSDLTAKFNAFMDKLVADGTLTALAKKYNLTLADQ
jgi:polar amino acid transport system substrate-binding protein